MKQQKVKTTKIPAIAFDQHKETHTTPNNIVQPNTEEP